MKDIANKKIFSGIVVSNKMDKTATVLVKNLVRHPLYQRIIKQYRKFYAHDEKNECQVGDEVMIMETRPISKNKRWRIIEILRKSE